MASFLSGNGSACNQTASARKRLEAERAASSLGRGVGRHLIGGGEPPRFAGVGSGSNLEPCRPSFRHESGGVSPIQRFDLVASGGERACLNDPNRRKSK